MTRRARVRRCCRRPRGGFGLCSRMAQAVLGGRIGGSAMRATAGVLGASAFLLATTTAVRDAHACGGCFDPPTPPEESGTVVTDHQMIFVTAPQQTTLYDMIKYTGSPASFAWVLPIHGAVTIGLSS